MKPDPVEQEPDDLFVPPEERSCICCGCTENAACDPPCSWWYLNTHGKLGLCSKCAGEIAAMHAEEISKRRPEGAANFPGITSLFKKEEADVVFTDSPNVGDPNCICSRCRKPIAGDEFPIRVWPPIESGERGTKEFRYHPECVGLRTS